MPARRLWVTDLLRETMTHFLAEQTRRTVRRGGRSLLKTERTPWGPLSFDICYCRVPAGVVVSTVSQVKRLFTFTLAHRVTPCCSDQRDTTSVLKSVLTLVWMSATPPPNDQNVYSPHGKSALSLQYACLSKMVVYQAFKFMRTWSPAHG